MKFSILQENLVKALSAASRAVSPRSNIPALGYFMFTADPAEPRLKIQASDLAVNITVWVPAKLEAAGSALLPAKTLADLVRALPADRVDVTGLVGNTTTIACGAFTAQVKGMPPSEFPNVTVAGADDAPDLRLAGAALGDLVRQVCFAAAKDDARPVLTGVRLGAATAAADGFRLALLTVPDAPAARTVLVPATALAQAAALAEPAEEVRVYLVEPRIIFSGEHWQLVAVCLEGTYPEVEKIMPAAFKTTVAVAAADLRQALRAADVFAREAAHTVRLKAQPDAGRLTVSATSAETGSNEIGVVAQVEGAAVEIAFNVRYLLDFLDAADGANVRLQLNSQNEAALLDVPGAPGWQVVVMPMHLGR